MTVLYKEFDLEEKGKRKVQRLRIVRATIANKVGGETAEKAGSSSSSQESPVREEKCFIGVGIVPTRIDRVRNQLYVCLFV